MATRTALSVYSPRSFGVEFFVFIETELAEDLDARRANITLVIHDEQYVLPQLVERQAVVSDSKR